MNLDNLAEYLKKQNENIIVLSFCEIENILGIDLPIEAKQEAKWWWNIKDSKKAKAWIESGYYTYDCKRIPISGNVCFEKIKKENNKEIKGIKRVWYFLTDKDAELHKKSMAFLEIFVLPLIALASLIVAIISVFSTNSETTTVGIINNYYENVKSDSQIEIVNIDILEDMVYIVNETETLPYIEGVYVDIKLRNKGDTVAFLKKIEFEVEEIFPLDDPREICYNAVDVSETYDVILDDKTTQTIDISQSIPANDVDRFRLKILSSVGIHDMDVIYVFKMKFIYDGDDKSILSARHIAVFPSDFNFSGAYISAFDYNIWCSNYNEIKRIAKLGEKNDDVIVSAQFQNLLNQYEKESKLNKSELIDEYHINRIMINERGALDEEQWEIIKKQSDERYQKYYIEEE